MIDNAMSAKLDAGETVYAAWVGTPVRAVAEAIAQGSWDAVVIDMQHGAIGYESMLDLVSGVAGAGKPAVVRMPMGDDGLVGRILDAGSQGVICPMVDTGHEAAALVRATKYAPVGMRSWGPNRAMAALGVDKGGYLAQANDICLAWAMIETDTAIANINSILSNKALDGVFVGPNDLCISLTGGKVVDPSEPQVLEAINQIARKAGAHSVHAGIYANNPDLARIYAEMGYRFIAIGNELTFARLGGELMLEAARDIGEETTNDTDRNDDENPNA